MKNKTTGFVVYKGKSVINGEPIMGIVTLNSRNIKTGKMAQLWILRSDEHPVNVTRKGLDEAICGKCILRQSLGGACYVNIAQGPASVYRAYKAGKYPTLKVKDFEKEFGGLRMRFGAYGDPYALPLGVLNSIKAVIKNNTSYTHQWKNASMQLAAMSMASVNNIEEAKEAVKAGWRYFRVTDNNKLLKNEIICPNATTGVKCYDCKLCSGNAIQAKNIVIPIHGNWKNKF